VPTTDRIRSTDAAETLNANHRFNVFVSVIYQTEFAFGAGIQKKPQVLPTAFLNIGCQAEANTILSDQNSGETKQSPSLMQARSFTNRLRVR